MTRRRISLAILLLLAAPLARAQYVWIDDRGTKQLSDRPPPPSVPQRRILKAPGKPVFNPDAPAEPPPPVAPRQAGAAERNAAYAQRQADAAEAARLADGQAARKKAEAANCAAARSNQRALDDGLRLVQYGPDGQRHLMTDDERAAAARDNREILANCK